MAHNDYKKYYAILRLPVTCTATEIKSAYRSRAMELHPDRNFGKDTTSDFQALKQAYETLSNQIERDAYDSECSVEVAPFGGTNSTQQRIFPVVCVRCSCVSAQPRYRVFYYVFGLLRYSHKQPVQGFFCSSCELRQALKTTMVTSVIGWWGIPAFFWTLHALYFNLFRGEFDLQNGRARARQAFYFMEIHKLDLAEGAARSAVFLFDKVLAGREALGEAQLDEIRSQKNFLEQFVASRVSDSASVTFKSVDGVFNKIFFGQIAGLLILVLSVVGYNYFNEYQGRAKEINRLEHAGFSRQDAEYIVKNGDVALREFALPAPYSGIYRSWVSIYREYSAPLKINNSPSSNVYIKINNLSTGMEVMSVFVRAGDSVEVMVPYGKYSMKFAAGRSWYGEKILFGPDTRYEKMDSIFEFATDGYVASGREITLQATRNGNMATSSLDSSDF